MASLSNVFRKFSRPVLDLVFPMQCFGCGDQGRALCPACATNLPKLASPFCPRCAQPGITGLCSWCASDPPPIDGVKAPFRMAGAIREAIHAFKYRGLRAVAPELAQLLAGYLEQDHLPGNVLVPVPLHPRRLRRRGYNQAALLARQLGELTGITVNEKLLWRTSDTPPQVQTGGRLERARSMMGAFQCTDDVRGLSVVLLDDVTTTGSTLSACARALKASGAASVWGLALAKEA